MTFTVIVTWTIIEDGRGVRYLLRSSACVEVHTFSFCALQCYHGDLVHLSQRSLFSVKELEPDSPDMIDSRLTYLVAFYCHHFMQRADVHPGPQGRNIQEHVKRSGQLPTMEKPFQILPPVSGESGPSLGFEAQIPLKMVLANIAVDFAMFKLLFVGVLLDEACL